MFEANFANKTLWGLGPGMICGRVRSQARCGCANCPPACVTVRLLLPHIPASQSKLGRLLTRPCHAGLLNASQGAGESLQASVDLKREAAYNLVQAFMASGSKAMALQVMREHLTI